MQDSEIVECLAELDSYSQLFHYIPDQSLFTSLDCVEILNSLDAIPAIPSSVFDVSGHLQDSQYRSTALHPPLPVDIIDVTTEGCVTLPQLPARLLYSHQKCFMLNL